jgi:hypothetical protein
LARYNFFISLDIKLFKPIFNVVDFDQLFR